MPTNINEDEITERCALEDKREPAPDAQGSVGGAAKRRNDERAAGHRRRIDYLKSKHQAAQLKLDALRTAGSDKGETLKLGI